jgi:hypothetical protein
LDDIKIYVPTTYFNEGGTPVPSNVHADAVRRTTNLANRFPVPVDIESSVTLNEAAADANNNRNLYNVLVSGVKTQGNPGNNSDLESGAITFGTATYTPASLGRIPSELSSAFGNIDGTTYVNFSPNMREHVFRVQFSYQLNEEKLIDGNEDFVEFVSPLQP